MIGLLAPAMTGCQPHFSRARATGAHPLQAHIPSSLAQHPAKRRDTKKHTLNNKYIHKKKMALYLSLSCSLFLSRTHTRHARTQTQASSTHVYAQSQLHEIDHCLHTRAHTHALTCTYQTHKQERKTVSNTKRSLIPAHSQQANTQIHKNK